MIYKYPINYLFAKISQKYFISPDAGLRLKNVLNIKLNIENAFTESEKQTSSYSEIMSTIDSHIADKINQYQEKSVR